MKEYKLFATPTGKKGYRQLFFKIKNQRFYLPTELNVVHWDQTVNATNDNEGKRRKIQRLKDDFALLVRDFSNLEVSEFRDVFNMMVENKTQQERERDNKAKYHSLIGTSIYNVIDDFVASNRGVLSDHYLRKFKGLDENKQPETKGLYAKLKKINYPGFASANKLWYSKLHKDLIDQGYTDNYILRVFKDLKAVTKHAIEMGVPSIDKSILKYKVRTYEVTHCYLTKEEIDNFNEVQTINDVEEKVKTCFILRYRLGVRFNDMNKVTLSNVEEGNKFTLIQRKTRKKMYLQIDEETVDMIRKYDWSNYVTQQAENRIIKELCERAGINADYENLRFSGMKEIREMVPKHIVISSHTARRSFARHKYDDNPRALLTISRWLGHAKVSTTLRYIGYSDSELL